MHHTDFTTRTIDFMNSSCLFIALDPPMLSRPTQHAKINNTIYKSELIRELDYSLTNALESKK